MSEEITQAQIDEVVAEAKAPGKFSLKDTLEQKAHAYPEKSVTIYWNAKAAGEALWIEDEVAELKVEKATLEEQQKQAQKSSMVGDPEIDEKLDEVDVKLEELEAKKLVCLEDVRKSALTFKMRGVAPKLWRAIDAKWKAKITAKTDSEEDQQAAFVARNEAVTLDCVSSAVISVTDADGNVDDSVFTSQDAKNLHDILLMSEWQKLKNTSDILTFGNGYFQQVVEQDADFLPKP